MLILENPKLISLLEQRDAEIKNVQEVFKRLNVIGAKIEKLEKAEKEITAKAVPPKDLVESGEVLVKQITDLNNKVLAITNQINDFKLSAIPKDMKDEHFALLKERESLERDRNKVALKIQKYRDKYIPLIRKEVKPLLKEFEDIETVRLKNGKVLIPVFDRLEEFKRKFRRK